MKEHMLIEEIQESSLLNDHEFDYLLAFFRMSLISKSNLYLKYQNKPSINV